MSAAMMRGVADAMLEGRAAGAEGAAAHSAADAAHARRLLRASEENAEQMHSAWQKRVKELERLLQQNTATAAGALIVINSMLKAMESDLSPTQREDFRQKIVRLSREKINEIDARNANDPAKASIAAAFRGREENRMLGVI